METETSPNPAGAGEGSKPDDDREVTMVTSSTSDQTNQMKVDFDVCGELEACALVNSQSESADGEVTLQHAPAAKHGCVAKPDEAVAGVRADWNKPDTKSDRFCWVCHTNEPEEVWLCKACPRAFHNGCCFRGMPGFPRPKVRIPEGTDDAMAVELLQCPECIMSQYIVPGQAPIMQNRGPEVIAKILKYTCAALREVFDLNPYINIMENAEADDYANVVAKVMDIQTLQIMVEAGHFNSLEGFIGELKWIQHNSFIFNGKLSPHYSKAVELMEACETELTLAVQCAECYIRSHEKELSKDSKDLEWFMKPCNPPHILVWAKYANYPFWPCKVLIMNEDKTIVKVQFFGDQSCANVLLKDCRLYSNEIRFTQPGKKWSDLRKKAVMEINKHIEELKKVHGPVILADNSNTPMVENLEIESIRVMFPQYGRQLEANSVETEAEPDTLSSVAGPSSK